MLFPENEILISIFEKLKPNYSSVTYLEAQESVYVCVCARMCEVGKVRRAV